MSYLQPFVSVLGPSIAAGLAAYLSIRLGLRRYAREKAFDGRREWYEQAMRVVVQYAETMRSLVDTARRAGPLAPHPELAEELARCIKEINPVLSLAYLYATPRSIEAVEQLFSAQSNLLAPFPAEASANLDIPGMIKAELFARTVGLDFAKEFRSHLGLESLPRELVPSLLIQERALPPLAVEKSDSRIIK
ncbi:MAG TPA: hypothetical protein VEX86_24620 [Longimicrobium sp.]|nr:hypothetical protein [Longimicrobium sp.]